MKIRLASRKDFKDWLNLRKSLWPEDSLEELETEMHQTFTARDNNPTFLAEDPDQKICGFIEVSIHKTAPGCRTRNVGYIEGWYVKPEFRKLGIGKKLAATAEKWAAGKGCKEMASDTTDRYPLSPVVHSSLGYEKIFSGYHFRKPLA